jgi:hypothetical protein
MEIIDTEIEIVIRNRTDKTVVCENNVRTKKNRTVKIRTDETIVCERGNLYYFLYILGLYNCCYCNIPVNSYLTFGMAKHDENNTI